jgi:GntR family transcriptional regulator
MLKKINIHSSISVYEQIENQVKFAIASGLLKDGDQLPSIKELGERLGINFNTVAKAYRDLEVLGLIYTRRGMGCFVQKGVREKCTSDCYGRIARRVHEVVQEAKAAGMPKKFLNEVLSRSLASQSELYGDVPKEVIALSNHKY